MALPSFRHLFPLHVFLSPIDTIFTPYCSSSPSSPDPSASAPLLWFHAAGSVYLGTVEASYEKLLTESSAGAGGEITRNDRFIDPNSDFDIRIILYKPM